MLSSACHHCLSVLAQKLYDRMIILFSDEKFDWTAASILLQQTYSSAGAHKKAQKVRAKRIKQFGNKVTIGVAWTEVNDELVVNYFT